MKQQLTLVGIVITSVLASCKTVNPYSVPKEDKISAAAERGKIYSCTGIIQDSQPTPEKPLAGQYVVTSFGDSGTLTWMVDGRENEIYDADCRYDRSINVTTCETYGDSAVKSNGDPAPIWAFTIDHAHADDVRIMGFNGKLTEFKESGKPMPFLGMIAQCPDETKR